MIWTGKFSRKELDAGTRFRAVHSGFLARALKDGWLWGLWGEVSKDSRQAGR